MTDSTARTLGAAILWASSGIEHGTLRRRLCPSCGWFWRFCTCIKSDIVDSPLHPVPEPLREHTVTRTADDWAKTRAAKS